MGFDPARQITISHSIYHEGLTDVRTKNYQISNISFMEKEEKRMNDHEDGLRQEKPDA